MKIGMAKKTVYIFPAKYIDINKVKTGLIKKNLIDRNMETV